MPSASIRHSPADPELERDLTFCSRLRNQGALYFADKASYFWRLNYCDFYATCLIEKKFSQIDVPHLSGNCRMA
jgi:hypothetical protein